MKSREVVMISILLVFISCSWMSEQGKENRILQFSNQSKVNNDNNGLPEKANKYLACTRLSAVIVGDILHSRVALSNIYALQMQGAEVKVCGPKTLIPKYIESLGVTVEPNLRKALEWCDVANMLRVQNERMDVNYFPSTREYAQQYGVDKALLDSLNKEIIIMHPGPINRGVEITSDVADSQQSVILDQVENGVAIRMAVIYLLAAKIER
jgi:aspartate carbamoyltransferase catalytic subunit